MSGPKQPSFYLSISHSKIQHSPWYAPQWSVYHTEEVGFQFLMCDKTSKAGELIIFVQAPFL